jgi:adenylate cyclase
LTDASARAEPAAALSRRSALAVGAALIALAALLPLTGPVQALDRWLFDRAQLVLRTWAPQAAQVDVVVIGIDDATLRAFPEPVALWHGRLATLFSGLAGADPRAVGLDIELPERSLAFIDADLDRTLLKGLAQLARAAPLVVARGLDHQGRVKPVFAPYLAVLGPGAGALAAWETDADGVVRRFEPQPGGADTGLTTFSGALAQRAGGAAPRRGLVDYTIGAPFDYLPAVTVHEWAAAGDSARLREAFGGKLVLIGSVLAFEDRHRAPVALAAWERAATVPGVLLHAQAVRTLLGRGPIAIVALPWVMLLAALAACAWFAAARPLRGLALAAAIGALLLAVLGGGLQQGLFIAVGGALAAVAIAAAARIVIEAALGLRQRQWLRRAFAGAVSPNVLALMLKGELDSSIGSGRRTLCVMFGDIRDFTPLTEERSPEEVVDLLNRYFTRVTDAVHRHEGTIDNFRGDGIMCLFGAPLPVPDPARNGFLAAQAIFAEIDILNAELHAEGRPPIVIGLSLALGEAVVGRVGAHDRHEYTAIGDVANVSARLESLTRVLGYPLLVNLHVAQALQPAVRFDDLGEQVIKGHAPVHVCGWPAHSGTGASP